MSLASHALSEGPLAWSEPQSMKLQKVPQSRRIVPEPDDKATPETR